MRTLEDDQFPFLRLPAYPAPPRGLVRIGGLGEPKRIWRITRSTPTPNSNSNPTT